MTMEHDLAISTHAYYVGEIAAGLRSCERLLHRELEPKIEHLTLRNRVFYMSTLQDLMPVEYYQMETEPAHPGWSLFNPSVYLMADGRLTILLRSSNYRYNQGNYIIPEGDNNVIKTESILCELNDEMQITKASKIKCAEYPMNGFAVEGIEDARMFEAGGILYVSGTTRNCHPFDGACRMVIARLNESNMSFENLSVLTPHVTRHEKNWSPIVNQPHPRWLYSCGLDSMTKVQTLIGEKLYHGYHNTNNKLLSLFRGGTQTIPFESGYLTLIHEVAALDNGRVYSHRFVRLNSNFEVEKYSIPFYLRTPRMIEFAAGMTIYQASLLISFGHMDESAWIAKIPMEQAKRLIS